MENLRSACVLSHVTYMTDTHAWKKDHVCLQSFLYIVSSLNLSITSFTENGQHSYDQIKHWSWLFLCVLSHCLLFSSFQYGIVQSPAYRYLKTVRRQCIHKENENLPKICLKTYTSQNVWYSDGFYLWTFILLMQKLCMLFCVNTIYQNSAVRTVHKSSSNSNTQY